MLTGLFSTAALVAMSLFAVPSATPLGMANTAVCAGFFVTLLAIPHVLAFGLWPVVWLVAGACALLALPLFPKPARP